MTRRLASLLPWRVFEDRLLNLGRQCGRIDRAFSVAPVEKWLFAICWLVPYAGSVALAQTTDPKSFIPRQGPEPLTNIRCSTVRRTAGSRANLCATPGEVVPNGPSFWLETHTVSALTVATHRYVGPAAVAKIQPHTPLITCGRLQRRFVSMTADRAQAEQLRNGMSLFGAFTKGPMQIVAGQVRWAGALRGGIRPRLMA
jgi:hypothetical protein